MATTTTDPTTAHFREVMRRDIGAHLRMEHGITDVPKSKMAQDKLHRSLDHSAKDARSTADASVLAGVTRKPDEAPAANQPKPRPARKPAAASKSTTGSKPAASTTRKPAASKPAAASKSAASKPAAPRKRAPKPAEQPCTYKRAGKHCIGILKHEGKHIMRGQPAQPQPETAKANGASPREHNQELARRLADLVAKEFGGESQADQVKVANWLHALPTGGEGAGWLRYWPQGFARPTSAGWRKPE